MRNVPCISHTLVVHLTSTAIDSRSTLIVQLTSMADPSVIALATELTGQTRLSDTDWNKVEVTAQALANSLRVKNGARFLFRIESPRAKATHCR